VWQPSVANEEQRRRLQRCRLVRIRVRIKNQLDSTDKNEDLMGSRVGSAQRRQQIEALPLTGWYAQRRKDLLGLLEEMDKRIQSYLGLTPAEASGGRQQQPIGDVTKQGNKLLPWL
jgi:hypothetical protein